MTEIQKSKQCLVMEGFGHAQRRRLRRVLNIGYWNLRPARSCLAMAGGFICNLLARRLSGGVLEFVILDTKPQGRSIYI